MKFFKRKKIVKPRITFELEDGMCIAYAEWPCNLSAEETAKMVDLYASLLDMVNSGSAYVAIQQAVSKFGIFANQEQVALYILTIIDRVRKEKWVNAIQSTQTKPSYSPSSIFG